MAFEVLLHRQAKKDLANLPSEHLKEADRFLEKVLPANPFIGDFEKFPLQGNLKGWAKIRLGDYRLVYQVHKERVLVLVVFIAQRGEVYKRLRAFLRG